jgi:predicted DNA-binding transcriptional regulator YafY
MPVVRFLPRSEGPVCEAIRRRSLLALDYGDGERVVEPYCHGLDQAGSDVLRAYQVRGPSRLGHRDSWRLFRLERASGLRVLDDSFDGTRADYNERDPDVVRIHCQVTRPG